MEAIKICSKEKMGMIFRGMKGDGSEACFLPYHSIFMLVRNILEPAGCFVHTGFHCLI